MPPAGGKAESARNFLGFRDGSANPDSGDDALMTKVVWVGSDHDEPRWSTGGSYQVVRIIRNFVERWDRTPLQEQQRIIGRNKMSGTPLDKPASDEFTAPDFAADQDGAQTPLDAHIRLANPRTAEARGERYPTTALQLFQWRHQIGPARSGLCSSATRRTWKADSLRFRNASMANRWRIHQAGGWGVFLHAAGCRKLRGLPWQRSHRRGAGDERRINQTTHGQEQDDECGAISDWTWIGPRHAFRCAGRDAVLDLVEPIAEYKIYVSEKVEQLEKDTAAFVAAVKAKDVHKAKTLFAPTRMSYEAIEPIAELFSDLDKSIDSRADDHEKAEADPDFSGFHPDRIRAVGEELNGWACTDCRQAADGREGTAVPHRQSHLSAGEGRRRRRCADGGGRRHQGFSGEEDRYSHTDLWDFRGNFDGAHKIVELVRPLIAQKDASYLKGVETNFTRIDTILSKYKEGDGYKSYDALTDSDRKILAAAVNTLAEDLSKLRGKLGLD